MMDLKPCPKCKMAIHGYKAVGNWKQYLVVQCLQCGYVAAHHDEAARTRWGAKRVWNRRADNDR